MTKRIRPVAFAAMFALMFVMSASAIPEAVKDVVTSSGASGHFIDTSLGKTVRLVGPDAAPPVRVLVEPRKGKTSGLVKLNVLVDANGHVSNVTVTEGSASLSRVAVDAVYQWQFHRVEVDDKRYPSLIDVNIRFKR